MSEEEVTKDMNLSCKSRIYNNSDKIKPKDIISYALKMKKESITYDLTELQNKHNSYSLVSDDKSKAYKINAVETGIYFIFANNVAEKSDLLYIGKAKDVKGRLRTHLVKRSAKTNSKLKDVREFLVENNRNTIYYCSIEAEEKTLVTIEGALIDYVLNRIDVFTGVWNTRQD